MESNLKIYHTNDQKIYDGDCYMVFLKNGMVYLNTINKGSFKLSKPRDPKLTVDNIDGYAETRGFDKVVDIYDMGSRSVHATWYNGFNNPEKKKELKRRIRIMKQEVSEALRYRFNTSSPELPEFFQQLNLFCEFV